MRLYFRISASKATSSPAAMRWDNSPSVKSVGSKACSGALTGTIHSTGCLTIGCTRSGRRSRSSKPIQDEAILSLPMPELPDIVVYVENLESRLVGRTLKQVRLLNPFLLRTATPPIAAVQGKKVAGVQRLGKRIVIAIEGGLFMVLHLMIAGRLRWFDSSAKIPGRIALAVFEFENGTLLLTEAGTKRRASLHLVEGESAARALHAGGLDILESDFET